MNHQKVNFLALFCGFVFFASCGSKSEFNEYKTIENAAWKSQEKIAFSFDVNDTISPKNLFINIRNNKKYAFSNLYIITALTFPNGTKIVDTLQYEMADLSGKFLGNGISDLKDNKLFYKESKIFPISGTYLFEVAHAMRKNGEINEISFLEGVTDVGFSVKKVLKK